MYTQTYPQTHGRILERYHAVEFSMSTTYRPQNAWPTLVAKEAQTQSCMHHINIQPHVHVPYFLE